VGKKKTIFAQGDATDAVFYIQKGKVKLTVVSSGGKEATIGVLGDGDFFGEGYLAGQLLYIGSACAMTNCEILRIDKQAMMLALHSEQELSDLFVAYLLARNIRYQEDLVDQVFNSSEKRLARTLSFAGPFRQAGSATDGGPRDQSNHIGGNGGYHALTGELFYEPVPESRIHPIQRRTACRHASPQFPTHCGPK
jgi:hypothetical protein